MNAKGELLMRKLPIVCLVVGLGTSLVGCDKGGGEAGNEAASSAKPATTAKALATPEATAAPSASAAEAEPEPDPGLDLFAGAPDEGKSQPKAFMGVSFDLPSTWNTYDDRQEKIISAFSNMPSTAKGRLFVYTLENATEWASVKELEASQKEKEGKVTDADGKVISTIPTQTFCETAVFEATNVHHTKVEWVGGPQAATFGAAKSPGVVLEAKEPKGEWKLYCVRIAITDTVGVGGAFGWRLDKKDSEEVGKAVVNYIKSFRKEGS